jgi:tetratricopeptide (TPR) repeat protein
VGEDDLLTAEACTYLGTVLSSRKGEFKEALEWHQQALASQQEELGEIHEDVIASKEAVELASWAYVLKRFY